LHIGRLVGPSVISVEKGSEVGICLKVHLQHALALRVDRIRADLELNLGWHQVVFEEALKLILVEDGI
jgi:hypothetical protein